MDRKACCDAEIIECINRIIEKDNDKLYDKLKKMGIAFAAMTVRQISLLEKRIATAMKKWHKSEKTSLLNSESLFSFLSSHTTESEADAELVQAVSQAVEETCGDVLQASADQYIRQTDAELSVTEISAPTAAAVSEASVQAGTSVLRHVTDEISNIIQEAINNDDSVDDAAKRIFDDRLRDEYYEARRVAQTEMMRTHAYAKYEALQQSPVVNAKRWRHTGAKGAASRENHVNISGQTVPKDQPFTLTGRDGATYHPMLPHDTALPAAEAINCHCILEAVIDKDLKSLPPEQKAQMQRDNIRVLNENYAEKSGKYKQFAGLPVDNQENGGIMNLGRKFERREQNNGAFSSLDVPMQKREVLKICKKYSIATKGITFKIQRSEKFISLPYFGSTDYNNIGRIDLFPNAFCSEEELVKTILHEKCHVLQLKRYGKEFAQLNIDRMEKQAYRFESIFFNIIKKR